MPTLCVWQLCLSRCTTEHACGKLPAHSHLLARTAAWGWAAACLRCWRLTECAGCGRRTWFTAVCSSILGRPRFCCCDGCYSSSNACSQVHMIGQHRAGGVLLLCWHHACLLCLQLMWGSDRTVSAAKYTAKQLLLAHLVRQRLLLRQMVVLLALSCLAPCKQSAAGK
jgi:hypothetical protein